MAWLYKMGKKQFRLDKTQDDPQAVKVLKKTTSQ
jgi:hypothetical protein